MSEGEPRKLSELRVVDLRVELEKRGLEKSGVKAALIDRLGKALREEGKDPDTYLFLERAKRLSISTKEDPEPDTTVPIEEPSVPSTSKEEVSKEDKKDKESEDQPKSSDAEVKTEKSEQHTGENEDSLHLTIEEDDQLLEEHYDKQSEEEVNKADDESTKKTEITSENKPDNNEEKDVNDETDHHTEVEKPEDSVDEVKKDNDGAVTTTTTTTTDNVNDDNNENQKEVKEADAENGEGEGSSNAAHTEDGIESDTKKENSVANDENGTTSGVPTTTDNKENDSSTPTTTSTPAPTKKNDKDAGRSLWISGLASKTRATDLKQLLSKYGKVVGAKVVANARAPSARCYGYVVMASVADADNCIKYCHRTELHGRFISIDKARSDRVDSDKRKDSPNNRRAAEDKLRNSRADRGFKSDSRDKQSELKGEKDDKLERRDGARYDKDGKDKLRGRSPRSSSKKKDHDSDRNRRSRSDRRDGQSASKDDKSDGKKDDIDMKSEKSRERRRSRGDSPRSQPRRFDRGSPPNRQRNRRSPSFDRVRGRRSPNTRKRDVLSVKQIREDRERQRLRQRERELREAEERRRREEQQRVRELDRRNKKEASRLERERERLRIERERLQREKADLIRMERKRIEQERIELQNLKLEESRRPPKRPSDDRREAYPEDRKRIMMAPSSHRYDNTDPMHFEITSRSDSLVKKHDIYKSDDYKPREIETKPRGVENNRGRDEYKRNDIRINRDDIRDDIRMRPDIRPPREEYGKRDRPDFAPPPPRLSGGGTANVISKYNNNVTDSPPSYGNQGRSAHDLLRRETISSSVIASVRSASGIGKDMRYNTDRVGGGPPGQSPEPSQNAYRGIHDDRRDHNDHRSGHGHVHRGYDLGSMKDYGDRDHPGGWHSGNNQLKPFPSPVGMVVNSNNDPTRDTKKFEPWIKGDNNPSMMWSSAGRGMDPGPTPGRYDRSNMERR